MSSAAGDVQRVSTNKRYFDDKIRSLSDRQAIWLRNNLGTTIDPKLMNIPSTDTQNGLVIGLSRYENFKNLIEPALLNMAAYLIPEENFGWLIGNIRAQLFCSNVLITDYLAGNKKKTYGNGLMNSIYNFFDFLEVQGQPMHIDEKINLLNNTQLRWHAVRREDNYSNWLDETDIKQIEWTRDYLNTKKHYSPVTVDTSNYSEIRAVILGSLDLIDPLSYSGSYIYYEQSDRKERIIDKMKRAWSQQKYRDAGKTKKSYHLPLTKQTQVRLEKMAKVNGLSQTAMLDILINSEYRLKFLDLDGNELY